MTKCLDNTANNKPLCGRYKSGDTECAACIEGYRMNAEGKCVKSSAADCEIVNNAGECIKCNINASFSSGSCTLNTERKDNCV